MSLSNSQYEAIMREYDRKRSWHREEQQKRREEIFGRFPYLLELDREMSSLAVRQARKLLDGDEQALLALREECGRIGKERQALYE